MGGGETARAGMTDDSGADELAAAADAGASGAEAVDHPDRALGYEAARDELVQVVRQLEAGGATLEESLALWEHGERLAAVCQRWLDGARARLDAVTARAEPTSDTARAGED